MDPVLLESPTLAKAPGFGCPVGAAYESLLKDSIDRFLTEIRNETCDLSGFHSIFFRLLQSRADPPLEIIWFYSAVCCHENFSSKKGVPGRVSAVRDLLQLLAACSASCSGLKSISLLAPVVYELYQILLEVDKSCDELSSKELKKLRKQIYHLAEGILSYVSICSSRSCDGKDASVCLLPCFVDLVHVWTAQRAGCGDTLGEFFPLVNDEVRNAIGREGCPVRYLAGVVTAEAFLLMLYLKLRKGGNLSAELQSELRVWTVGSVTGFKSRDFLEILLMLLLGQDLPFRLVSSIDEAFLRCILYDCVILVDYSFLYPGKEVEHSYDGIKSLSLARLIVTHEAIQAARAKGDQDKAIAYMDAFSRSSLPSSLIKLLVNQIGAEKLNEANAVTPQALIKCLLNLDSQGHKLLEFDISKFRDRLLLDLDESKASHVDRITEPDSRKEDDLFFFDNKGLMSEDDTNNQDMEMMDGLFLSAARNMKLVSGNEKKRKGLKGSEGKMSARFVKYKLYDYSFKDSLTHSKADEMSSESDVENPPSDEMEETE
uniref:DNA ligase 4 n=1 Tax=Anthurium amnicola TaxID=1678845 RepID=A0A1D1XTC1_9ARAE